MWDSCRNLGVDRERPISDLPDPLATAVGGESRDFSLSAHFEQLFFVFRGQYTHDGVLLRLGS